LTDVGRRDEELTLAAGTRLGPYEVLARVGAGGMGEVYRARDERLGREVAVKVLPPDFSSDPDRLRRFELEAKAAGALNHPNLVAVFDTGQHEGNPYVVFELLDGVTLRQRLGPGPLPVRKAVDYAVQIAQGLAAAHEKGIVHRDLKPENLFVTKDGRVKVLDFGLAKLQPTLDAHPPRAEGGNISTATGAGIVLGTAGYMSPEQVRGDPADHRSDIFSFGSVLYEMVAGKPPFPGETQAETMTAILKVDPPPLAEAGSKVLVPFERIVRHCLEKQPDDRFQSARDLVFDLESVATASNAFSVDGSDIPRSRLAPLRMLAAAMLGGAVVLGVALWRWPRAPEPPVFKQVTFRRGNIGEARFAPDGQTIVYGAAVEGRRNRLFSARLGSPEVRALELPEGDIAAISASGEMAIVLSRSYNSRVPGTLARVSFAGGAPRELAENVSMADWGPDGRDLAVVRHDGPKPRLEFPIGKVLYESETGIKFPRVSPKGDRVAFFDLSQQGLVVRVVDLSGKTTTLATGEGLWGLAWSPKGDEVWFTDWDLMRAVTLAGQERILTRVPGPITINDVSPDGRVLVTMGQQYNGLVVSGPGESPERDLAWFEGAALAALSRDGDTVLFSDRGRVTGGPFFSHTYLRRTDGSPAVRLGEGWAYSLSPDGKWAISGLKGLSRCLLLPTGPGEARPLPVGNLECKHASWFPDGKRLLVAGNEPGRPLRLFAQDLDGRERRAITPEGLDVNQFGSIGLMNYFGSDISPDGKLIAAKGAQGTLVLFPVEGGEPRPVPGTRPDEVLAGWGADSQSVYVYPLEGDPPVRIDTIDLRSGRRQPFKEITPPDLQAFGGIQSILVTPGGKAYAYQYGQYLCTLYVIEGLR
jgi:serine/threonine protein kinase/dipeptidyl aminopeptidase/acylaminoacyl peptidase